MFAATLQWWNCSCLTLLTIKAQIVVGQTDAQMTRGSRRTIIFNPPAILIIHLKRFEQVTYKFSNNILGHNSKFRCQRDVRFIIVHKK